MRESAVASHIRYDAACMGVDLWRNNVGALLDENGRPVRYGLLNDSKEINARIKSSDLIGITSLFITPDMVGQLVGVFTAIETKESNWVYSENDKRAKAQKAFHDLVIRAGGFAGFASSVEDARKIMRKIR